MSTWQLSERERKKERERHNLSHTEKPVKININDVVMKKEVQKNRGKWKIGIIEKYFQR